MSRRYSFLILAAGLFPASLSAGVQKTTPPTGPAVDGNRAPHSIVLSADGRRAYVTEMAEATVAVVDVRARRVLDHWPTGGDRPTGIALSSDGRTLVVANSYSGDVSVIDAATGARRFLAPLPGEPSGVTLSKDGKLAYVSLRQLDQVAVLDLNDGSVRSRVGTGRRPQSLALTADGSTLAVSNLSGGSVSVIDTEALEEVARVPLKGVNVRGLAITGTEASLDAYTTVMPAFNAKATSDPKEVWHNLVQAVRLEGETSAPAEDQWMDFARLPDSVDVVGTPDQQDLVLDQKAKRAWVSVGGRDVVTRITIRDRSRNTVWPFSQVETPVGANPRGLAITPDDREVWVANHLGNSLTVVDADTGARLADVDLGRASRVDPSIFGQYLFNNAGMTRLHRFSCSSCHPDGSSDGLTWSFVHVKDGFVRRNSRDLRNGVPETAPFRWSGVDKHLDSFIDDEVTGLLGGPKPTDVQRRALALAIRALRLPPNPYRERGGGHTAAGERGRQLFAGRAGCSSCHSGPNTGGSGSSAWIGTTARGLAVDVPQLRGVFDGAPYLHDGRARTLEEVFERHNQQQLHGKMHELSEAERADLLRYVREL
ncbi:MAG: beta-propeller fold lactonase family protein [Actinomycetota bacterium]